VLGLITARDILGEKPMQVAQRVAASATTCRSPT
jgi:hypothetical protein